MPVVNILGACYKKLSAMSGIFQNLWTYQDGLSQSKTTFGLFDAKGIASNNAGLFVAVGLGGRVATSTDGVGWTYRTGLSSTAWGANDIYAIAWSGSLFIVVGAGGKVATSPDGVTWTYQANTVYASGGNALYMVAWANNQFIAGGANATLIYSSDGVTWTSGTSNLTASGWGSTNAVRAAIWFNNSWAIGGDNCSYAVGTPTWWLYQLAPSSGLAFNKTTWGTSYGTAAITGFAASGSLLMALGATGQLATSADGIAWTWKSLLSGMGAGVSWTGTTFFIATSTTWYNTADGTSLTSTGPLPFSVTTYLAYASVYDSSIKKVVIVGQQGASWTTPIPTVSLTYQNGLSGVSSVYGINGTTQVIWAGSQFIAVGKYGRMAVSPDGVSWTFKNDINTVIGGVFSNNTITCVAYNGTTTLVGTSNAYTVYSISYSPYWVQNSVSALGGYPIYGMCVIPSGTNVNKFVIVGAQGRVAIAATNGTGPAYQSASLTAWNSTTLHARAAAANSTMIFVVGDGGKGMYSTNGGTSWTVSNAVSGIGTVFGSSDNITGILWNGSLFMAWTSNGKVATSPDGLTWTSRNISSVGWGSPALAIVWSGTQFVATAIYAGMVATSPDGITWTLVSGGLSSLTDYNTLYNTAGTVLTYSASLNKYLFINNGLSATWS